VLASVLLALVSAVALSLTQTGAANAAEFRANAAVSQAAPDLTPAQTTEFNQTYAALTAAVSVHPDGAGCPPDFPYACGWIFSKAQTQAMWKLVVNNGINAAAKYCRGLFSGALTSYCNQAADILRNLSAPNGRCFFVGLKPAVDGSSFVAGYTKYFCS
jgi:hypothetical protein